MINALKFHHMNRLADNMCAWCSPEMCTSAELELSFQAACVSGFHIHIGVHVYCTSRLDCLWIWSSLGSCLRAFL